MLRLIKLDLVLKKLKWDRSTF